MNAHELHVEMHKTMHRFKRLRLSELSHEISKGEFYILKVINKESAEKEKKAIYVSELAQLMNVTTPAISRMLKSLEDKELVQREVDRNNRRNTFVHLTDKAGVLMDEMEEQMNEFMTGIINRMGEDNVEKFMELFNQMVDAMEAELEARKEQADNKTDK